MHVIVHGKHSLYATVVLVHEADRDGFRLVYRIRRYGVRMLLQNSYAVSREPLMLLMADTA